MTLAPTWRMDAALAYIETLQARGVRLEVQAGLLLIPEGETPGEVELVRLLKPELLDLVSRGTAGTNLQKEDHPIRITSFRPIPITLS